MISVLHCTVLKCTVLHCTVLHFTVVQDPVYSVVQHTVQQHTVYSNALYCNAPPPTAQQGIIRIPCDVATGAACHYWASLHSPNLPYSKRVGSPVVALPI